MGRLSPGQWFEAGIWVVIAGVAYGFSLQFDRDIEMYKFGAAGWPRLIILLIVLGALGHPVRRRILLHALDALPRFLRA